MNKVNLKYSIMLLFFINLMNPISSFNFENVTSLQHQDFNFGGSITINTWTGNLTNFSELQDSNTGASPPNDGDGITWSSAISKWVATVLDSGLIWKKIGNIISPLNASNLDMGGGNVTANYYFGDGSQLTGLEVFRWIVDSSNGFMYTNSNTMFFNYTRLDDFYYTKTDYNLTDKGWLEFTRTKSGDNVTLTAYI